tara:strand:+ start:854 stop:1570 length:717 start_codon:yes stop_codon:yes gene_type:complete
MKKMTLPKLNSSQKKNIRNSGIFVLGVIVTLLITTIWNKAIPETPVIVKEVNDSIKIVHEYKIPEIDDSLELTLERKLKNLELLNNYDKEIDKRIKNIENKSKNATIPNLISINNLNKYEYKGYSQGKSNSYFTLDCPNIDDSKFIDFKPNFFNPEILKDIAFFRLNIHEIENAKGEKSRYSILTQFYNPKSTNNNFIRIENNLAKGKYEFFVGFTLKKDLNEKYPTFYLKKCTLIKK